MPSFHNGVLAILDRLPGDLPWLVAFKAKPLLALADAATLRQAWFLPDEVDLRPDDTVVLTAAGHGLVAPGHTTPRWSDNPAWPKARPGEPTLLLRYGPRLADLADPDTLCIGLGCIPGQPPTAMAVGPAGGDAAPGTLRVRSAVARVPDVAGYELLAGCGVRFEGVARAGDLHVVSFLNRLPAHLTAALASNFERTENCNLFFLRGMALDAELRTGLIRAGVGRIRTGAAMALSAAIGLALDARRIPLPMTALAPSPATPEPMGDLVPLGLLLRALRLPGGEAGAAAATLLERHLDTRRSDGLWPFQTGRLVTATDSGLVLMGRGGTAAVASLERFADGQGGYLPQLTAAAKRPGHMLADPSVEHWTRADLGTTLVVRLLRHEAGLGAATPLAYLAARFEARSGLFFANPFLIDWLFAAALGDDPGAAGLRHRLADEVAAAVDPDWGFGTWDRALSTALAILALAAAGRRGRLVHLAQLRLLDLTDAVGGPPVSTPFYSTMRQAPGTAPFGTVPDRPGILRTAAHEAHELTLYEDTFRIVGTALRALALAVPTDPEIDDLPAPEARAGRHARYRTHDVASYVRDIALPPYLPAPDAVPSMKATAA